MKFNDKAIFLVIVAVLTAIVVLLFVSLWFQYAQYSSGVDAVAQGKQINHVALLVYSRAWDFAVIKTSSLFLSFLLIFAGAIFVLKKAVGSLSGGAEYGTFKGSINVSGPGLVLAFLGVCLAALTIYNKTEVGLTGLNDLPITPIVSQETQQ